MVGPGSAAADMAPPNFAFVRSLERGLAVIASFGAGHGAQSVADVARRTGLDRAAARRLLLTLATLGYVEQDGRRFRLAPRTLQLGYSYLASLPWWRTAQEVSKRLAEKIEVPVAVGVLDGDKLVYVAYAAAGPFPALASRSIGAQFPAAATSTGRILLAGMTPAALAAWLTRTALVKYTPRTVADPIELARLVGAVREAGYAVVDQELSEGFRSLAVPVRDRGGEVVASLGISIVDGLVGVDEMVKAYLAPMREAAAAIAEGLGT